MQNLDLARDIARHLNERLGRESVPVRAAFIASPSPAMPPPLTQLLRGGRGGEVKVKLLLSMIWVAAAAPYDVTQPARVWAELLGLPDPEVKGAARVNAAIRRLVESGYLSAMKRPGQPSRLTLQNELGTGEEYSHPGAVWDSVKEADARIRRQTPRYTRLPIELWTAGWIAALSGPALAMLVILLESARGQPPKDLWFAPSVAAARYGLNEATRKKGLDELEQYRLISVGRALVVRDSLSTRRKRNTYSILVENFKTRPEEERPMPVVTPSSSTIREDIARLSTAQLDPQLTDLTDGPAPSSGGSRVPLQMD